jgi:zinc/manganese transport system permease protein
VTATAFPDFWALAPMAALAFGVLALAPLGEQVLARGVVFVDLAVAQAGAAAALWMTALVDHPDWLATQLAAVTGALACVGVVAFSVRCWPAQREALIGLVYVAGAGAALLGAQLDLHGRERMAELLAADVLWAGWPQVAALAACAVLVRAVGRRLSRDVFFYPVFALAAAAALQILGLFVVFAALIAPALWRQADAPRSLALGGAIGACAAGLAASWAFDVSSGACAALSLAAFGWLSATRRGLGNQVHRSPD